MTRSRNCPCGQRFIPLTPIAVFCAKCTARHTARRQREEQSRKQLEKVDEN